MAKILIVDDSKFARKVLVTFLTKDGHEIVGEAANGKEAIELYKEYLPDLITMDIIMPIYDGITALKEIISLDPDAKVIMCTDIGQQAIILKALKTGAKNFIVKPFSKKMVNEVVTDVLKQKDHPKHNEHELSISQKTMRDLLSLDRVLIKNPENTFSLTLMDDSMIDAGFNKNDIMIIRKNSNPKNGDLVLATVNNNFVFGYYKDNKGSIMIEPANSNYEVINSEDIEIVGVVTGSIRKLIN